MKRFIPLTLAGVLSVSGLVIPSGAQAAPGAGFRDVAQSHWATQVVNKLSLRDVIAGYEDNTFRPNESVTQLQAVVLAIRNMGLTEQAALYKTKTIPYTVPDWAKGDIALAIEKGLLKTSEKNFNPNAAATRAWVAQLIVRMIGKESEVNLIAAQNGATTFTDGSTVPEWAENYVKAASKYGLLSGYPEKNGYSFKPNRTVTRAEMAALLSGAEKYLEIENDRVQIGYVQGIAGDKISFKRSKTNQLATYSFTKDTAFYANGKAVSVDQIKPSSKLMVIVENGVLRYVEVLSGAEANKTISATVEKVYVEEGMLVVKTDDGQLVTYQVDSKIPVGGAVGGTASSVKDLLRGDAIFVTLAPTGGVLSITRLHEGAESAMEGTVHDIDTVGKLLMIKTASGAMKAYKFNDSTYVEYKSKRFPTVGDLIKGDNIRVETEKDIVTKIIVLEAKQAASGTTGTVKAIYPSERFMTIQGANNTIQSYRIADAATLVVPGVISPLLSDIASGDQLEYKVDNNVITSITVKNRAANPDGRYNDLLSGIVFAVDASNRILTLKNSKGDLVGYEVLKNASFVVDGVPDPTLSNIRKDMNVSIQLDQDNKVVYVNADNRVKGQILRVDTDTKLLTVRLTTGETKVYVADKSVDVEIYDERGEDIDDLRINDNVSMRVSNNKITDIDVERSYVYRITEVNESSERLSGENDRGNSRSFYLDGKITLTVPGVPYPKAKDVKKGDTVKATYLGDTLKSLAVIPSTFGQVVSVNAETSKIRIKDYNGVVTEVSIPRGSNIRINDRDYTNLTALKAGDRIQLSEASNGLRNIVVLKKVATVFQQLDAAYRDRIYTAQGSYYLPDSLFARHPNLDSLLNSFVRNDKINIYLLDNQVYEIEKGS